MADENKLYIFENIRIIMDKRAHKKHIISTSSIILLLIGISIFFVGVMIDINFKLYAVRIIIDLFLVVGFLFFFIGISAIIYDVIKYITEPE
ncbi:MAG: hypothetical protein QXZ12_00685 [Thermoplasmata archaeon]